MRLDLESLPSDIDLLHRLVRDMATVVETRDGIVPVINGLSLDLQRGETIGIVGESGCGKSITALAIGRSGAGT